MAFSPRTIAIIWTVALIINLTQRTYRLAGNPPKPPRLVYHSDAHCHRLLRMQRRTQQLALVALAQGPNPSSYSILHGSTTCSSRQIKAAYVQGSRPDFFFCRVSMLYPPTLVTSAFGMLGKVGIY
ncbi:hypothetical protein C8R43DRAFT_474928 [Mycena crocata]|nr:hypothetical protein C8R43DRAFT_474928 [Mycena crocata]